VTLDLYTATNGSARLDLNRDTSSIKTNISALVSAYNNFDTTIKELGNSKSTVKDVGGSMVGDSYLQTLRNQVRNMITANASTPGNDIKAARDMGISFDRYGQMTLDSAKLDAALQDHFDEVVKTFTAGTNNKSVYSPAPAGIAGDAYRNLDRMLRATGQLTTLTDDASKQVTKYQADLSKLDDQMQKLLDRYTQQFSLMDSIVGNSNSTRSSLTSTFAAMNNTNKN
jgi:flagellar hook-associated protein 2